MFFTLPFLLFAFCHHWQEVPEPLGFFVTRWSSDLWSQMSYSFVKTGGSGEAYDILAEDVQGKLFFAGEVTLLEPLTFWLTFCFFCFIITIPFGCWCSATVKRHTRSKKVSAILIEIRKINKTIFQFLAVLLRCSMEWLPHLVLTT